MLNVIMLITQILSIVEHIIPFTMYQSGRIGKVVASHAAVARSSPAEVALIYTMHVALWEYCP